MPISRVTKLYAVQDAKIAPLTADPAAGTPTYGALIDVPGIKEVEISGDIEVKELRGDNTLLDSDSAISNITVSFPHAKLSLDVLAAIMSSTVTDAGTGATETSTWDLANTGRPTPFKFEAVTPVSGGDLIGGDVHFLLHKCILSSFPTIGLAEEDYRTPEVEAQAVPLISTGKWLSVVINKTATAIA